MKLYYRINSDVFGNEHQGFNIEKSLQNYKEECKSQLSVIFDSSIDQIIIDDGNTEFLQVLDADGFDISDFHREVLNIIQSVWNQGEFWE